jgi:uncharacterized protein involved in exopolysaccharide biosynthesis
MNISVASQTLTAERGPTVQLAQLVRGLRRYAWLIILSALVFALLGLIYARTLPKTYTATTSISVEGNQFAIPELQGALRSDNAPDPMPFVRTEVQALSSRALVQKVIDDMQLSRDPEFNPALQPPSLLSTIKSEVQSWLPQPATTGPKSDPDEAVLALVNRSLALFQDNRSLVISLTFTAQDPKIAADFLNRLLSAYIQSRAANRNNFNEQANSVLVQRTAQAKADLDAIEKQMQDLRDKTQMVTLRAGSVGQQQLEDLATAASRATMQRTQLEADWDRASALAKQGMSDALATVIQSPTISRMRDLESEAAAKYANLSAHYGANYPGVRAAAADLASIRGQLNGEVQRIVASMGAQVKVARDQEAQVKQQLADARRSGVMVTNSQAQLTQLEQEEKSRRAIYQTLLEREQQTGAQPAGAEAPDVRVISPAVPSSTPSGPNGAMIAGASGLSGALLGCLLALTRLHRLEDSEEFTRATGVTVMGSVSHRLLKTGRQGFAARVIALPPGVEAEIARNLRTRVSFAGRSNVPRTVMFTSTRDNDSAAIIAAAVARIAAADGERVLLIEADLQHPMLGKILGSRGNGMADILTDFADWRDVVERDGQVDLDMLLSNQRLGGADGLLGGLAFQTLLLEAREDYDLVVIEAPVADSSEAAILAPRVDAAIMVTDMRARRGDLGSTAAKLTTASRNPVQALLVT